MGEARLILFGTLHLHTSDQPIAFGPTSTAALLGYLALYGSSRRAVPRTVLAGKLWPGQTEERARNLLNQTLYRLRRTLGPDSQLIQADSTAIRLVNVQVDIDLFKHSAASERVEDWQAAIELYAGDLLEDLDADWLLIPRVTLRDQFLNTLMHICDTFLDNGRLADAFMYARRWVLADPFNEEAHRLVMRLSAHLGRHNAALQQYDHLVRILDEEFRSVPLPETRALAATIRAENEPYERELLPPSLIGRRLERTELLHYTEQALEGRGRIVLVEGEAGIGKTQLLEALAESASWRGMRVAWGSAVFSRRPAPFAPLNLALRAALAGPRADQIRLLCAESTVQHLPAIVAGNDQRADRIEDAPAQHAPEPFSDAAVMSAYADILQALGTKGPQMLILDNMQWADPHCWMVIQMCGAQLQTRHLLVVLSYRGDDIRTDRSTWRLLRALDRDLASPRILLGGLSSANCRDLARTCGVDLTDDATAELRLRTGGNPLFVREMLAAASESPLPATVRALFDERLARLPDTARFALAAASVLGEQWAHTVWQEVAGTAALQATPLLLERQFIVEHQRGYRFRHDLLREHLYQQLAQEFRRDLHRRAADALGRRSAPLLLAWHYEQAEVWHQAVRFYDTAGDEAARAQNYVEARDAYLQALIIAARLLVAGEEQQIPRIPWQQIARLAARWQSLEAPPARVVVPLARAYAPLGRSLSAKDRITVSWTVDAGASDAAILHRVGKVALRRYQILRLLAEAHAQGAAPTDLDLAHVLRVSERTIVADIAALQQMGYAITTRRRKQKSG